MCFRQIPMNVSSRLTIVTRSVPTLWGLTSAVARQTSRLAMIPGPVSPPVLPHTLLSLAHSSPPVGQRITHNWTSAVGGPSTWKRLITESDSVSIALCTVSLVLHRATQIIYSFTTV